MGVTLGRMVDVLQYLGTFPLWREGVHHSWQRLVGSCMLSIGFAGIIAGAPFSTMGYGVGLAAATQQPSRRKAFIFGTVAGSVSSLAVCLPGSLALSGHVLYSRPHTSENWAPLWIVTWGLPLAIAAGITEGCAALFFKQDVVVVDDSTDNEDKT